MNETTVELTREERIVKRIDDALDRMIFIGCLILLFFGGYSLLDSYSVFYHAADRSLLKIKQNFQNVEEFTIIADDLAGWITLDDSGVDYPVMQGDSNSEYLNKDPYGSFSMSGSIFLDTRNAKDFSDSYSLLYGHHMENYAMFGALDKYLEEDFFNSHESGTLMVGKNTYALQVFAVVECDSTVQEMFAPNEGYDQLAYIQGNHTFYKEPTGDHLISLSTCKYPNSTERTIVVASFNAVPINSNSNPSSSDVKATK